MKSKEKRIRRPALRYDVELLRVMADESRQSIMQYLCTPGAGEMRAYSVTDIHEHTGLSTSTASHHLQILRRANLVVVNKEGRRRLYRLNYDLLRTSILQFRDLIRFMDEAIERNAKTSA